MSQQKKELFSAITTYIPQLITSDIVNNPLLPDVRGQFRHGTLLFADISGFTAMSERLGKVGKEGAEELAFVISRFFMDMVNIASLSNGFRIKFGGDAILLFFHGHNDAARAIRPGWYRLDRSDYGGVRRTIGIISVFPEIYRNGGLCRSG